MTVTGVGARSSLVVQSLGDMRTQLGDLQRQLGTGKKSTTYAGLGIDRGLAVGLRTRLAALSSYSETVTQIGVRANLQQASLTRISALGHNVKSATLSQFVIDTSGQTATQRAASSQLDEILGLLNTPAGDRYLFSGRATDKPATDTLSRILNGDVSRAGFKQVMAERLQADLGANGLGRLTLPAITSSVASLVGTGATITPDAIATVAGTQNLGGAYTSGGGTLTINGTNITINAGDDITDILAAINAPAVVTATGVTATAPGGLLTLTATDDDGSIDLTGTTGSLITEFGIAVGPTNPTNLLTQGAVTAGQTLTVTIGTNPTVTVTFGTNEGAVPPEVSTLAELNAALATLTGGTASASVVNGNITITASNTTDAITVGGDVPPATFGLAATSALPSNVVGLSEDAAGHPFGFKLAAIATTATGATVTGPAGSPAAVSVDFRTQPAVGETVSVRFDLPDGSTETLTLTATASTTPGPGEFTIGASLAATSTNFRNALNTEVGKLAASSLSAASAMKAADQFFNVNTGQPPMRVAGPPYNTATALVAGTSTNTITWYTGEMGTDSPRGTAVAKVDDALSVSYGARANEQAIRSTIANIAVYASMTFSSSDPNAQDRFLAMSQRVGGALAVPNGQQKLEDIEAEIAFAQTTMADAKERQQQRGLMLEDLLQGIEQAPQEEVAAQILALQTRLQASLQTTAMLYQMSIIQYL
jgi:flagellar hook-associated protein 3 FlgL